jgi:hypothetical protein
MAYLVRDDIENGRQIKAAIERGEILRVFQPGPFGPDVSDGEAIIEAPKFPKPHRFYTAVIVSDGRIVRVKR